METGALYATLCISLNSSKNNSQGPRHDTDTSPHAMNNLHVEIMLKTSHVVPGVALEGQYIWVAASMQGYSRILNQIIRSGVSLMGTQNGRRGAQRKLSCVI